MSNESNWLEFFEDRERLHADYYLDFAQQHARRDPKAYDQLEAEIGNLLKIAAWLSEQNKAEDILKLATVLWEKTDFLRSRGYMQRGLPLLEQAHQAAHQIGNLEAEFTWLEALANVHWSTGNPALAQSLYEQALVLAQESNEPRFKAQAQLGMGRSQMERGHLEQAAIWLKKALQGYRQIQDNEGEITTLITLGNLLSLQGDSDGAVAYIEQGFPLVQARQDRHSEVALHHALGYTAALAQDWPKAIIHFKAATDMARATGDRFFEIRGLASLGEAWLVLGDVQQAVTLLEEALTRQKTSDDILTKAFTHFYLAKAYHILGDPNNSLIQLREVYPFRQVPILAALAVEAAWLRADNYLKQNKTNMARTALHDVLNLAPDHMTDIRQTAKSLLEAVDNGEQGA
jgi:tetratricopeptide (TPR) repeat protein